jgi:hypothetical protein
MRIIANSSTLRWSFVWSVVFLVAVGLQQSPAQTQGRITGRVTDSSGAVIIGARVTLENTGKAVKRTLETNNSGDYVAPGLEPGVYAITVEAPNFKKTVREHVQIEVAKDLKIDFQLTPGAAGETLEVKDEAPLVDATTSTLNGVLSNKAINELPLQGRDFQNLLDLHPGVQRTAGGGFHSVTSNGLRPDDNNFVIDGANDNDAYWGETVLNEEGIQGTPASNLPLDAIQEFNTQEHPQADFGQKPGVVVNIGLKSGTDQIHGSAYYFHRNELFDARNFFDHSIDPVTGRPAKAAALLLHQFGASIGGPIIKGKWFYFANYEGVRSKVGNPFVVFTPVTQSLATPDNPAGDPATSIVDAINDPALGCNQVPLPDTCKQLSLNLVPFFPKNPGFTARPDDPTAINYDFNNHTRADNLVFKSDYHFNEHHVVTGRYIYANTNQTEMDGRQVAPQWLSHAEPVTQVVGVDWTWTPNSRWVNTARFSHNSFWEKIAPLDANIDPTKFGFNTGVTDPRLFGFPTINANLTLFDDLGGVTGWPTWTSPSHTENFSDTASYTIGRHAIRFGGVFSNGGVQYLRAPDGRGVVYFDSQDNNSFDSFLSGNVFSWSKFYGDPSRDVHMRSWGMFAQDDFRVTRHLTLNLGLRYDVTYPIHDTKNRLANFVPSQGFVQQGFGLSELYKTNYGDVSPRIGAAWDVFGNAKTVMRAGFGMIYVQPSIRSFMYSSAGLQLNPTALIQPGANGNITTFLQTGAATSEITWDPAGPIFPSNPNENVCAAGSPCDFFAVDRNLKTPYVLNWNFNWQQAITPNTVLQVAYVANHGVHLYSDIDLNQPDQALAFQLVEDAGGLENVWPNEGTIIQGARPFVTNCTTGKGLCAPYIRFLNFLGNLSSSNFQSLQTTLTHRYSNGLYLLAGYTWEHAIDVAGNTNNLGFAPQNSLNYAAEKGNGDYDIRHRFTLSATYDMPSRKSWGQMLEGWQVTGIFQAEAGQPVLLWDNTNDLTITDEGPGNGNNDRWNILGDPKKFKISPAGFQRLDPSDPICQSVATTPELQRALNWAGWCWASGGTIFYPNAMGTFGNMGRNILHGPMFVNLDFSVGKAWKLNERLRLQLRAEFFNLLNHANFASPSGNLASRHMGELRDTPDIAASNPVIGSGGSRHIQLGAKFIW